MKLRSKKNQTDQSQTNNAPVELQIDGDKGGTDTKPPTKRRKVDDDDVKARKNDGPSSTVASTSTVVVASNNNIDDYIAKIARNEDQRRDVTFLHQLVTRLAPKLEVNTTDFKNTIAYGKYHYKYKSGREGDWYKIGVTCGKEISFHCCGLLDGKYVLESFAARQIGTQCSVGKSCVRFKALSDLNVDVVENLILATAEADILSNVWGSHDVVEKSVVVYFVDDLQQRFLPLSKLWLLEQNK